MNPLRVAAVFRRIVAQFRRDPRSLALLYIAPLAIIALLGWVDRGDIVCACGKPANSEGADLVRPRRACEGIDKTGVVGR